MTKQDPESIDVLQFVKSLRESNMCNWIFEGLDEKEIDLVERRTAEQFRNTIPAMIKLRNSLQTPEGLLKFETALRQVIKTGGLGIKPPKPRD